MNTIQIEVIKAVVLIGRPGPDTITLTLDAPTPFPEMGYDAQMRIEARKGYGIQWCKEVLQLEPEVIDAGVPV